MTLINRYCIVTGAAIANALVAQGARVTIADRDETRGQAVAQKLGDAAAFQDLDVSPADVFRVTEAFENIRVRQAEGHLKGLTPGFFSLGGGPNGENLAGKPLTNAPEWSTTQ